MMRDCSFCDFARAHPDYVIHTGSEWSVAHVHRRWPAGSVFMFAARHITFIDAAASLWASAAPLFAAVGRALVEVCDAERVYMLAFSENSEHFHFLFVPKRAADAARHGRKGVPLLSAFIENDATFEPADALAATARLRQILPGYIDIAEREPDRAGNFRS